MVVAITAVMMIMMMIMMTASKNLLKREGTVDSMKKLSQRNYDY